MTQPFVIEQTYDASIDRVWDALTNPEKMKQWYFDIPDFKPEIGNKFHFMGCSEDKEYKHECKILELVPFRKMAHTWKYTDYPGESIVTFELFDLGSGQTKLRLTHTGLETFPKDDPNFARESFAAGWTDITGKLLPDFLKK